MAVSLQKGQKVELRKANGNELNKVVIGLGWDAVAQKRGFFARKIDIDCDASAFVCSNGKLVDISDVVYFGNLTHKSGTIRHMGDNLTGEGDGDDEQIFIDLKSLPNNYDKIVFVVNIYKAFERKQHFGLIENAFIRVCDGESNQELCKYNLSENYDNMTAMIFGEVYRYNGTWKFNAIGQATQDNDLGALAVRFQ